MIDHVLSEVLFRRNFGLAGKSLQTHVVISHVIYNHTLWAQVLEFPVRIGRTHCFHVFIYISGVLWGTNPPQNIYSPTRVCPPMMTSEVRDPS